VVLYEEDPADQAGKRFIGSAIWRTEIVTPGSGQASELAMWCGVEIPERRLAMTMSIRRNTDKTLPASHTVEIRFSLAAGFPFGGINNVPGLLMKEAETTRGAPLTGLAFKASGFFLLGLSAVETEAQHNFELLKERGWFDIPVIYSSGRRAIIAVEKGNAGERAFSEAFNAWERAGSASYGVQVASQRTEAEVRAAYRMLQTKYPKLLKGHRPVIRRADLGERGVFYRAWVGPFATAEEARQMCNSLKAAGGQCVVQRN
jgi:hypothetical protein